MSNAHRDYRSYLLRLWRIGDTPPTWRASLESPHTGEVLGFASVTALLAFLEEQTGSVHTPPSKDEA